jgi:hypothetical protein
VFTSVDAVKKILIPLYGVDEGKNLLKQVEKHQLDDNCIVLHKYPCSGLAPQIDWNASSIRL